MTQQRCVSVLLVSLFLLFGCLFALTSAERCDAQGKVKVSENKLDSAITQFLWLNSSTGEVEAIFVLTRTRSVYRSVDEGKTFEKLDTKLPPPIDEIIPTANSKQLYFFQRRGKMYTTDDQGEHYKLVTSDLVFASIEPHPTESNWALAQVVTPACSPVPTAGCSLDLYLTQDFGVSWDKKAMFVAEEQYDWGNAGKDGVPVGNVFYINFPNANPTSNQPYLSRFDQVFQRTPDLFKTSEKPRPHSVAFKYYQRTVIVAQALNVNDESLLGLFASHDDGDTWGSCAFPTTLSEYSYHIADLTEGTAFVSVDHTGGAAWATTYVSDSLINRFSVALNYTRRNRSGKTDFRRINGVEGVYIANKYVIANEDAPLADDTPVTSVISFDKGGEWQPLSVSRDQQGHLPCAGCSLNLVGFGYGRRGAKAFHSRKDTPGILLATGSVGPGLEDRTDEINAYISRDAGMNWAQIAKGEHIYEMSDFGSLILLSPTTQATTALKYTWDQGSSVVECDIASTPIQVREIYNSPSGKDLSFIVYGVSGRDTYLIHVDFKNSGTRTCDPRRDYENWSPSDANDDQCLLGQRITYTRRKQDSKCFNPEDYERPNKDVQYCACKREDFQCDYCFVPDQADTNKCVPVPKCPTDPYAPPVPCNEVFNKTQGYRLVPGDKCTSDKSDYAKYAPALVKCNGHGDGGDGGGDGGSGGGGGLSGGAIFGILVAVFVVIVGTLGVVGFVMYRVNPDFHDYVDANMPSPSALFSKFGGGSDRPYTGSGNHAYSQLNSTEPQSLLDDLDGDLNTGLDDDLLEDEAPELDDKSISSFTNQKKSPSGEKPGDDHLDSFL